MAAKKQSTKQRLNETISEMANALHSVGAMDDKTFGEFRNIKFPKVPAKSARQIKSLRTKHKVSQLAMARLLNINLVTLQAWERGDRKPSGAALKLLNIVSMHGLEILYK